MVAAFSLTANTKLYSLCPAVYFLCFNKTLEFQPLKALEETVGNFSSYRTFSIGSNMANNGDNRRGTGSSKEGQAMDDAVSFKLSETCWLKVQLGDITKWFVDGESDAIVNAANEQMLGGGGVDGAIHRAAGPELKQACLKVPEVQPGVRCPTGQARITEDYHPQASLRSAYRNSLRVANDNHIKYIAFPAISCGVYRFPIDQASEIAISTVKEFHGDLKEVHFVMFTHETYHPWFKSAEALC
ncbi:uncharacterized protein LOC18432281 isoform X3 [Amborella trichopoda]|uniref:uncharacterized protein LOC18432281 isoform X3 n=1 Tax=Amborella trichopoda TaxID=13333 RepID=UPI0009BF2E72|nr:uncharacterized protein LOC18432281 isoform X3 [Amborella trichopoda]|eukprot:XP_011622653.2 uncharacterized protein LOC18432281 isoform X3 [Amborella trichopoda]